MCLKRETGDDGEGVEADGKDERTQEFAKGGGRDEGEGEGCPAAMEKLFTSHMQPEGKAERGPFIQKQPQLRSASGRESQLN